MASRLLVVVVASLVGCGTDPSDGMEPTSSGSTSESPDETTSEDPPGTESAPGTEDGTTSTSGSSSSTGDGGSDGSSDGGTTGSSGSDDGSSSSSTGGEQLHCEGDGTLTISMSGEDQEEEGYLVWLSAVQPDDFGNPAIVVRLEDTVEEGAFLLECVDGLDMNFAYPSWAVLKDADDDGQCSAGDVAFVQQLFGWSYDQIFVFEGDRLVSYESEEPWIVTEDAWQPVGDLQGFDGSPFCNYYFP